MVAQPVDGWVIFFYFIPFVLLFLSKKINKQFKLLSLSIKIVDLLIPYIFLFTYILGVIFLNKNLIPYMVIVLSLVGIVLVSYHTFWKKELSLYIFFRTWWRYVFLILLISYIGLGSWIVYYSITG